MITSIPALCSRFARTSRTARPSPSGSWRSTVRHSPSTTHTAAKAASHPAVNRPLTAPYARTTPSTPHSTGPATSRPAPAPEPARSAARLASSDHTRPHRVSTR
ncbi:hypothetical protein EES37_08630 [Streptomyces sp. ADI91-18]|nr:hypothetical protein EES37_08630 [Streptomyces sp. ADI91-18]